MRAVVILFALVAIMACPMPAAAQVMGGRPVDIAEVPWQVALRIEHGGRVSLCGGSIVRPDWVLTAAHCVLPSTAAVGVLARGGFDDFGEKGGWSTIERIVLHEKFDGRTLSADIALLKLRTPVKGQPIALAAADDGLAPYTLLSVTGWGATAEGGTASRELMQAFVPYIDPATCNGPQSYAGRVGPDMLCAGLAEGGVDACLGDSGGPLVLMRETGPVLVGIVSFGVGCGRRDKYGVYTRVSAFRDWIDRVLASQ